MNVHKQVNDTPQLINTCLQKNMTKHSQSMTQHGYPTQMANVIIDEYTVKELNYQQLSNNYKYKKIWKWSFTNKLGILDQGEGGPVDGTDTMFFIAKDKVPRNWIKDVTYGCIIVDYWPQKQEPHRMRLTVGGNLIFYWGYFSTPTADIIKAKLIINSTISTQGESYMWCDIKKFTWEH